jgi:sugar phosphate isomerase/epimerase
MDEKIIKVGLLVGADRAEELLPTMIEDGMESVSYTYWKTMCEDDPSEFAKRSREITDAAGVTVSCLTLFGNPLIDDGENVVEGLGALIDCALEFGTDLVTGFAGRIIDETIENSIPQYKKVWGELAKRAADKGVRLAFENCSMGGNWKAGNWNMAQTPAAWEMMFDALPMDNIGLQWEPAHQMEKLIDPIAQLRKWAPKVFHVHGKDGTVAWDVVREYGITSPHQFAWHRTPGFGDTNWVDVVTILMQNDYRGSIDIEGFHDPVMRGPLEYMAQVQGMKYLRDCRGGEYRENIY